MDSKYVSITLDSVINQNDIVRRIEKNGKYTYYYVIEWDEDEKKYILESFDKKYEENNWKLVAPTQELIRNFQIRVGDIS